MGRAADPVGCRQSELLARAHAEGSEDDRDDRPAALRIERGGAASGVRVGPD